MGEVEWEADLRQRAEARVTGVEPDPEPVVRELRLHRIELELQNEALRETHADLERCRDRYRRLYEHAPVGYLTLDVAGVVLEANRKALELFESRREALLRTRLAHHLDGPEGRRFERHLEEVFRRGASQTCELWSGPRGRSRRLRFESVAAAADGRPPFECFVIVSDVTEQRRLEAELLQAQKMETLGRLVAGIAHDFGNVLTAVAGLAAQGRRFTHEDDPIRSMFNHVGAAADQGIGLVRRLLAFARSEDPAPGPVDVGAVVRDTLPLIRHLVRDGVVIRVTADPEPAWVKCDRNALAQALMNLVTSANDALPRGGTISIRTATGVVAERDARRLGCASAGVHATLTVADDGRGMDEATRARLFEPFFTTKPRGHGTGLGLSMVRNLVQRTGGAVDVRSELDVGTAITLYLPRVEAAQGAPACGGRNAAATCAGLVEVVHGDGPPVGRARRR
jgi:PAS domain S-box-containing protein